MEKSWNCVTVVRCTYHQHVAAGMTFLDFGELDLIFKVTIL